MRRQVIAIIILLTILLFGIVYTNDKNTDTDIINRITTEIDKECRYEGTCILDLNELFLDFEWDTVIFVSKYTRAYGIGINNGMLFIDNGKVVRFYSNNEDEHLIHDPILIIASKDENDIENKYVKRSHSTVLAKKKIHYPSFSYTYEIVI